MAILYGWLYSSNDQWKSYDFFSVGLLAEQEIFILIFTIVSFMYTKIVLALFELFSQIQVQSER